MKKQRPSVTIGIPAYNEEANILHLLGELIRQKQANYRLKKIVVLSDGSTDNTETLVKSIKDSRIKLIRNEKRLGLNATQNKILRSSTSDILVLLDADILPKGTECIANLIKPIIKNPAVGITSGKLYALRVLYKPWARIFANVHEMKRKMVESLPNRNNIFLCSGRIRAFSKEFYSKLEWKDDVPEDAYSYLRAIQKGFKFSYTKKAICFFHPPATVADHIIQNHRFILGKEALLKYFTDEQLKSEYRIPMFKVMEFLAKFTLRRPISIPAYLGLMFYLRFFMTVKPDHHSRYKTALSSKRIVYE
jgi:glycosyltransferase involved in cell wall biosynthesis